MHPFFSFGSVHLPAYTVMVVLGIAVGGTLLYARVQKGARKQALIVALFAGLSAILGAKALYLMTMPAGIALRDALLYGFVFYGGLIGGIAGALVCSRFITKTPLQPLMDAAAPAIAIGHGIGRIGCFFAGCCYGRPVPPPLGVVMPYAVGVEAGITLLPVQLIEAALNIALGTALLIFSKRKRDEGKTIGLYLMGYAVIRFALEFLRYDAVRGFMGGLSTGQWISMAMLIAGLCAYASVSTVEITLRNTHLEIHNHLFGGLVRIPITAGLYSDGTGRHFFQITALGKPIKPDMSQRLPANIKPELIKLLSLLRIKRLHVQARIGVKDDAALTAKLCGVVQMLAGTALGLAHWREGSIDQKCEVMPDFEHDIFKLYFDCIMLFKTGNVMRVGCKVLLKIVKGAYQKWRTRSKPSCVPPWKT